MPPNAKGGKGYKKKKKVTGGEVNPTANFIDASDGQLVARAIRLLGNRNVLCFCNDSRLRICHICGRMKGRQWIEPGDMVLVSLRDFTAGSEPMRGDIVAKYAPEQLSSLRRTPGVNERLFLKLETMDGLTLAEVGADLTNDKRLKEEDDMGGFVFESRPEGEESSSEEEGEKKPEELRGAARPRGGRALEAAKLSGLTGGGAGGADDDIDIDAI